MSRYAACGIPSHRHDFILMFDVADGNPNGDPDAGNLPRVDPETMQGLVTDVALKRKVRNFVALAKQGADGYAIYVNDEGIALNALHQKAYDDAGIKSTGSKQARSEVDSVQARMCRAYYDVRMFGAVMTTKVNAGQVRGPMQLTFARSVSPIVPLDISITRVAITKEEDARLTITEDGSDTTDGKVTAFGRKPMIPYALYVAHGFFSPPFAERTGVTQADLELFWHALEMMWDQDRSAARGMMACRGLYVFSHAHRLGVAPAHRLFGRFNATLRHDIESPRRFGDYRISLNEEAMPEGVALTKLVEEGSPD